ncbi:MAG TPA: hypothetical protein VF169_04755 [Albitalea sp.]|uniref:hypothetical protein n=1 Tax=Piscinibacter sp. TaxID=1903157 RepID=UPI002ECFE5B6
MLDAADGLHAARAAADKPWELDALLRISVASAAIGSTEQQRENERRGAELASELAGRDAQCWYMDGLAWVHWDEGRTAQANALWNESTALAQQHGLAHRLGGFTATAARPTRPPAVAPKPSSGCRGPMPCSKNGNRYGMAAVLGFIGTVYGGPSADAQDQAKAAGYFERSIALVDPKQQRRLTAEYMLRLGMTHARRNDFAQEPDVRQGAVVGAPAAF